ncbi:hypothetical protein GPALN_007903 [Globodera pallida]|nr:hypothetical protein GPALN_007903 [Globodera pallida]
MAIFKKLLASDSTTTANSGKKISSTSTTTTTPTSSAAAPSFPRSYSFNVQQQAPQQQQQQQQKQPVKQSTNPSPNGQQTHQQKATSSEDIAADGHELLEGLDDLCKSLYNRTLRKEKVRLTVFSEKDSRLLYDSETIVAVSDRLVVGSHRSQCGRFQFLPHKYDTLKIAKMLFGTLPSAMKVDSLKIHTLSDINYVMISRVFSVPRLNKYTTPFKSNDIYKCTVGSLSSDSDNQSNYSTIRSLEGIQDHRDRDDHQHHLHHPHFSCARFPLNSSRASANIDPPEQFNRVRNSSLQLESNDIDDIMEELRAFSPNRLSRTRRRQMSQLGLDDAISLRLSNRSRLSSCSSIADGCALGDSSTEWKQYGFALLLPCAFRSFIFQHILQVERELDRLVVQIHKAVQDRTQFLQLIYEGWSTVCNSLCLLCNSPRLRSPVWLSLVSVDLDKKGNIAFNFCSNLAYLIRLLNTKETKFFFSTAISAVLMNQLAWVASVAPPDKCCSNTYRPLLFGTSSIDPTHMPYNPAVAQLLELYSGIGIVNEESKFVKIVVAGENRRLVATMLNVLSYFIRCSSVESRREKILTNNLPFSEQQPLYDFGRSLLAGICRGYSPHFVLSGFDTTKQTFDDILAAIYEDVRHPMGEPCANSQMLLTLSPSASQTLSSSAGGGSGLVDHPATKSLMGSSARTTAGHQQRQTPSPDDDGKRLFLPLISHSTAHSHSEMSHHAAQPHQQRTVSATVGGVGQLHCHQQQPFESSAPSKSLLKQSQQQQEEDRRSTVVVLIDTQNLAVKLIVAENCLVEDMPFVCPSEAVTAMFEEFAELFSHHCASDFLLSFLEDRLGSLLAKSNILANLITSDGHDSLSMERVSAVLDCDYSDLRLILNIAAVYSPGIMTSTI